MIEQRAHAAWRGGIKDGSGSFHAGVEIVLKSAKLTSVAAGARVP
jgi:hypothetical protein